jgi:hypothetical protein
VEIYHTEEGKGALADFMRDQGYKTFAPPEAMTKRGNLEAYFQETMIFIKDTV